MARRVKTGDTDNMEAQAAKKYWPRLMGKDFKRGTHHGGKNASLNYGYTVLRSAVARSVLAAGLHPSLSLHHQSRGDALRLADDLMEPFRPWVDHVVCRFSENFENNDDFELGIDHKTALVGVLTIDLQSPHGISPMQVCMDRLAQSLVQVYLKARKTIELPGPISPNILR